MFSPSSMLLVFLVALGLHISWFLVDLPAVLDEAFPGVVKTDCEWQVHLHKVDSKYPKFGFHSFASSKKCPQCIRPKETSGGQSAPESSVGQRAFSLFYSLKISVSSLLLGSTETGVGARNSEKTEVEKPKTQLFHGNYLVHAYVKDWFHREVRFIAMPRAKKTWKQNLVQLPCSIVTTVVLRIFLEQQQSYNDSTSSLRRLFMEKFARNLYLVGVVCQCFSYTVLFAWGWMMVIRILQSRPMQHAIGSLVLPIVTWCDPNSVPNMTKRLQRSLEKLQRQSAQSRRDKNHC